jgi:hypothetical protein
MWPCQTDDLSSCVMPFAWALSGERPATPHAHRSGERRGAPEPFSRALEAQAGGCPGHWIPVRALAWTGVELGIRLGLSSVGSPASGEPSSPEQAS